jgi:signal transduction histidine kinase
MVGASGWAVERSRFGGSESAALERAQHEARDRVESAAAALRATAERVGAAGETVAGAARDPAVLRSLFDLLARELPRDAAGRSGVTVYDRTGTPLAWAGRVSDLPKERVQFLANAPPTPGLAFAPGALGLRLVLVSPAGSTTIVVEQSFASTPAPPGQADTVVIATSLVPVTLRTAPGDRLFSADVAPGEIARAREQWDHTVGAAVLAVLAVTLLFCVAPLRHRRGLIIVLILAARLIAWLAARWMFGPRSPFSPFELLLSALTAAAIAWLAIDAIERRRHRSPRPHLIGSTAGAAIGLAAAYAVAGAADVILLWIYERNLRRIVSQSTFDLLHFSLHPVNAARLAMTCGLVLMHAAVIWMAAAFVLAPEMRWRTTNTWPWRALKTGGWLVGAIAVMTVANPTAAAIPVWPMWVALAVTGAFAATVRRVSGQLRRAPQTARLVIGFLVLLAPAIAMYPSILAFATDTKERLIANEYGPQAASQRGDLEQRVRSTLAEIDALPALTQFVGGHVDTPTTDRAFLVWSQTELAIHRLTSAVELFNADGRQVSRFALSLPEYSTAPYRAESCRWGEMVDEMSPLGSSDRHVLRTSRGICEHGRIVGGIVVRAMLDPQTLPFISSRSPYFESQRISRAPQIEGVFGRDIELAMYGWSRAPTYAEGSSVWPLPDHVFQRLVQSRQPFWATIDRDDDTFRVYLLSDRGGIYALGYPVISWIGHLITVSELVLLSGALYASLLLLANLFSLVAVDNPASGRALLREVRSSFYLKLFLAFVASVVVPVAILALATRTYFANQLIARSEDAAATTVTTAQRLVEDYATLQQRETSATNTIDDQIMVLVRRAIDEDINLFDRYRLQATSARDLFALQIVSSRTPAAVYRGILLEHLPTIVADERVGDFTYRLAAAPVRAAGRESVVTVPLANRQQEIEQQIDELDRRVLSGALLFSLLGAALGYWMAERIADPVNRLTRATRRIARGDLDARIAATSSDELRRLVDDFNRMAADLKRQRSELERTQRLEAWADMARQVAHDIKNPLTPIQLSAEHTLRVNLDRGRPLSPVLEECVTAILTQVKLLRQISAEFSSFASSPTARPEPTDLPALVEEVVEPYRLGLSGRIGIAVHSAPDLPRVSIDRTLFSRALTNVIENALHAMPGHGTLTVSSRQSTANVVLDVTDTGVGMDQEARAKIFEPYFSTKASGTGLGLTIAKRNVELNGGTIDVTSERGAGTTVTITLPL